MSAEEGRDEVRRADLADDRLQHLYAVVASRDGSPTPGSRLRAICEAGLALLSVSGTGVMLMAERVHQGTLHATDGTIQQLEDLQNAAAEGPCIDAYTLGQPVIAPDLNEDVWRERWPVLVPRVLEAGIQALFSLPLQIDEASIGALNLYRDRPGGLTGPEIVDARLLAAMATREVLVLQAEALPGGLPGMIGDLSGDRTAIEQATGMVAVQLDADIPAAARRLREAAVDEARPLAEIAYEVVAGTRRFG